MIEFSGEDKLVHFFDYLVNLQYGFKLYNCMNPSYHHSAIVIDDITTIYNSNIDNIIIQEDGNRFTIRINLINTYSYIFKYPFTNMRKIQFINVGESTYESAPQALGQLP